MFSLLVIALALLMNVVARFVAASIEGWKNYLHGDNKAANAMIQKLNPEMTPELIAHAIKAMKSYGLVENEDTRQKGIGTMNPDKIQKFFNAMVKAGLVKADTDWRRAFSFNYINRGAAPKAP